MKQPVNPELFRRTAPAWNCIGDPHSGPHYLGGSGCLWCGKTHDEIRNPYPDPEAVVEVDL